MANEYLKRTPTSTGNRKVFTWSGWIKRNFVYSGSGNFYQGIFGVGTVDGSEDTFMFSDNKIRLRCETGTDIQTVERFRDAGNWMHIMMVADSTKSTSTDRLVFYVNGARVVGGSVTTNLEFRFNSISAHYLGEFPRVSEHLDGQMCDVFFVDGQALTPDVFGFYKDGNGYISAGSNLSTDFKPGQWVPKPPRIIKADINSRGGFGVNGFYLPMNSSNNFGADFHCTPNSILKLKEDLPQPKAEIDGAGDYTGALRDDPFKDYLVLAIPGVSGGLQNGFGDYSAAIRGSGSAKNVTANGNVGVSATSSYYGSALSFDGSGDYLSQTYNADFNFGTDDFTVEMWVYPNTVSSIDGLFAVSGGSGGVPKMAFHLNSGTPSVHYNGLTGASNIYTTSGTSIPAGQWSHLAYTRKGTTWTWYINGVSTGTGSNSTVITFTSQPYYIGYGGEVYFDSFDGKIQDFRIYKGVAKYKGGFDVPKPYTPVGIGTWREVPDTTANNFATMNAVNSSSNVTLSEGNLNTVTSSAVEGSVATVGVSTGKWYWEVNINATPIIDFLGITGVGHNNDGTNFYNTNQLLFYGNAGSVYYSSYEIRNTTPWGNGDIVKIKLDLDNQTLEYGVNGGSYVGLIKITDFDSHVAGETWLPTSKSGSSSGNGAFDHVYNFGQNPSFGGRVAPGTFTDSNGKGLFKYEPPTGFLALCEDNLPTPAIKNPGEHFKTVLYTGDDNVGRSITGVGFSPDFVWIKGRSGAGDHGLWDSVRGGSLRLKSNLTDAEASNTGIISLSNDGFSLGNTGYNYGGGGGTPASYVAWCWKAGGPAVTNTDGSITSQVSANQTAGFSIVSWTGNGVNGATLGHGLGKRPKMIISKRRDTSQNWYVWTDMTTQSVVNNGLTLNSTEDAMTFGYGHFTSLNESTATLTQGSSGISNHNTSGATYIAYCWAEIEGFSKFGSYVGNGNSDGPFVYCGFKPAWVMIKCSTTTNSICTSGGYNSWAIYDNSRDSVNPAGVNKILWANRDYAEGLRGQSSADSGKFPIDFVSNGFKIRGDSTCELNAGSATYIFAAFAESPFQTANSK